MNEYLRRFARQNDEKGLSKTFVAVQSGAASEAEKLPILGYYTLGSGSVAFTQMPQKERLPRYPVPSALLGRLAVDKNAQGTGLGKRLLLDALRLCVGVADQMGIYAVEVVALHEAARDFYKKFGFAPLVDDPLHLYLPLASLRGLRP